VAGFFPKRPGVQVAERRRRGKGEGSIYKLADGRWRASVDMGWHNGTRRRKQITRKTRAEATRELRRVMTEIEAGQISYERAPTLEAWMATYFHEVASSRVRPSTLNGYEHLTRLHITPFLGRHYIDKLRPQHITACYRELSNTLSPSSIRRVHAILRRALTIAVRWGLITNNPVLMVDPPSLTRPDLEPYSLDEATSLLQAAANDRLEARWTIALMLGLRQGEVLGLGWQHIDFNQRTLRVARSLQRQPDGTLGLVETKTQRSRRVIPMPPAVESALLRRQQAQRQERHLAGPLWRQSDLVFTTATGTPIHPRNDYRSFRSLIIRAGLRRVRLHDLRHTAASLLLSQGVAGRVVMEILGHSQIAITMNTYTHVDPELNRTATDLMEKALWPHD
jgi:integrase